MKFKFPLHLKDKFLVIPFQLYKDEYTGMTGHVSDIHTMWWSN